MSTISPVAGYGQDIGNVPTYQIGDDIRTSNDKIISTEGCFSCRVNKFNNFKIRKRKKVLYKERPTSSMRIDMYIYENFLI